ncbi:MBL fold metallo-hydrolase [Phaeobacter sp. J2-8]|uniref:MBL fold metallo-hydrolase n=1 Tax=Phaeobacter sp. J2-8 TaxID=2931394 RepID=UPI001FD2E3C0|nr:MBL fold metallo-hydrolase [Phaeobacter sp. J2-8]MCJ7874695.1 MBL fold metallo-hydrolase [Phaeobacter sp. J2-8]
MKVTLLGTGTPEPYARRASSGYLLDIGDETLQFDCGGGSFGRLLEAGRRPTDLDRLFLSHLHSDHMLDYARLVHAIWDKGGVDLPVFGPAPIRTVSDRLFGSEGALFADLTARTEHAPSKEIWVERGGTLPRAWPAPDITEIAPGFEMPGDGWHLRSVEVPHAQPFLTCMGFRVDTPYASFVYSGDSGPCDALTTLAEGADVLVHMCFNLSQEARGPEWVAGSSGHLEIARTARDAGIRRVVLTHLRPHMDAPGVHQRIVSEMAEVFPGDIVIGEDLMVLEL